jgi:acetyltransferase-like isoleucine patch superfamily enzyme
MNILAHDWFPRSLPANVSLGARSWLYSSFAFAHYHSCQPWGVRIGHDTGVYPGTFFDLGPNGQVEIGNYCTLVGAVICTNARVIVGNYTFIAHEVTLADTAHAFPWASTIDADVFGTCETASPVISLGENCWIGARATLLAGAEIGEGAIVGAATVVDFPVPPFAIVAGDPAQIVGWVTRQNQTSNVRTWTERAETPSIGMVCAS